MARKLDDVLERLANSDSLSQLQDAVTEIRDSYDVEHIVFHCVRAGGEQWAALTYPPDWVDIYVDQDFQTIDPVVLTCFRSFTAVDWKTLDWTARPARTLLAEALGHGLGNQGCSLPIRGPAGQFALFTVNHRADDDQWARFTRDYMDGLLLAAFYVNERALEIEGRPDKSAPNLSPRERDALSMLAAGRSRAQAAERLSISEHTLRVYIESARHKLGALNTTHAVANAMSRGLIGL